MTKLAKWSAFFISCSLVTWTSLQALLPPFYESVKEYQALLNSKELAEQMGSGESI